MKIRPCILPLLASLYLPSQAHSVNTVKRFESDSLEAALEATDDALSEALASYPPAAGCDLFYKGDSFDLPKSQLTEDNDWYGDQGNAAHTAYWCKSTDNKHTCVAYITLFENDIPQSRSKRSEVLTRLPQSNIK